ncbi:MAG TPA: alpha/beta hydrolase, partial [Glaciibacter sp.]|nr:alpha/beta hydrolase [Glaciibacter sp.]
MVGIRINDDRKELKTMSPEQQINDDLAYTYNEAGTERQVTVLFIHGFLDDSSVWGDVVALLPASTAAARFDLAGSGRRDRASGSYTDASELSLQRFVADAERIIDDLEGPIVIVGQSMGAQVAELAAVSRSERVVGLVLVTPVPVGGTNLPDEAVAPFRALGGQGEIQKVVRSQISPGLDDTTLDRLTEVGVRVDPAVVARYVDIWNTGDPTQGATSAYEGPVLLVRGGADGFVTEELIAGAIAPHFAAPRILVVDGGGHWLHVEFPDQLAQALSEFTASVSTASGWKQGFGTKSQEAFGAAFTEDVVLEASVMFEAVKGRNLVATVMGAASSIYEKLDFVAETSDGRVTYLQWKATAFEGQNFSGVTVLTKDDDGLIEHAAIHHRPLSAALR